ncbi:MAG: acyl carrier protein [Bacteroidetes bacterium]|jgi:acyl carrier protein|nr:acyl carrier protein [Bacteroidota bacterium]MBT3749440.1 acyl carrier protein [Bacteroidota bacterium]MBT4398812.1 acyl carrier protein [Bacteroidota bacterium]MBT4411990.1 acyl carrier protein [Bacteroidota bacterium]MBT5425259.1 acyl carrier protein [Bacteroidota bacterium]
MKDNLVLNFIIESISESSGLEVESINPGSTLFQDLCLTSIDMVEIFYMIEMEYDISLRASDFENDLRKDMDGEEFEIDNVITDKGLAAIRQKLPEINSDNLKQGLTVDQLIKFITVRALANLVTIKINQ